MRNNGLTREQANKIAWETVLSTGVQGAQTAIMNSLLRSAGRK